MSLQPASDLKASVVILFCYKSKVERELDSDALVVANLVQRLHERIQTRSPSPHP